MDKGTKIIIGIAAFALFLMLATLGYDLLSKKYKPQERTLSSSSQTQATKESAPDFIVKDTNGNNVSLSDFNGKPVVLNFWASWCPPCKSEMPDYEKMYKQYSAKGVVFMMVNLTDGDRETTATARQFLKDNHYTFTAYFDVKYDASNAYDISSIPDSIFIDKDGNIINVYQGMIDAATMKKNIEAILK
jgi:thiol-disulfide isomerase/thioredoxin